MSDASAIVTTMALMILSGELSNIFGTWLDIAGIDVLMYGLLLLVVVLRAPKGLLNAMTSQTKRKTSIRA